MKASKIVSFSAQNVKALRGELNATLKALGEKYGVVIEAGSASYNDSLVNFKLKVTATNSNGEALADPKLNAYGKACVSPQFDASKTYHHRTLGEVSFYKYRPTAKAKWVVKQKSTGKFFVIYDFEARAIVG